MRYTHLRNATGLIEYNGRRILIDPALDPAGARPAIANTANPQANPLVELPEGWQRVVEKADAFLVTHLHKDHFDDTAAEVLPKHIKLFCQTEDADTIQSLGFEGAQLIESTVEWEGVTIHRTPGSHGSGEIARMLAPVSGFVMRAAAEPTVYFTGDTIWTPEIDDVIASAKPEVIVINASGASFLEGGHIVMNAADIVAVRNAAPHARLILVHLDAINHCHETRAYYREHLPNMLPNMANVYIPEDGDTIDISRS